MPIWTGSSTVVFERSGEGQTASVLDAGDAVLATCDDAGVVKGPDGSTLLTAALSFPRGDRSRPTEARVDVTGPDGSRVGSLAVRRYKFGPFSKQLTIGMLDAADADVGELSNADRKGRELSVTCGDASVARLELADRDRGLSRTVERWSLNVERPPSAPGDLLAAAAILRYNKLIAEVAAQTERDVRRR